MRYLRWVSVPLWIAALYLALIWVPDERSLGVSYRIFYIHLGMAWTALLALTANFVVSLMVLLSKRRREKLDSYAQATAEVGLLMTSATLASGMLWAKVAWGAFWTWDPRLTTTAILWFLYAGYLLLREAIDQPQRRMVYSAVYGLIVFIDVPIVYLSVRWWASIHPVVFTNTGMNITPQMLIAVIFFFFATVFLGLDLIWLRAKQQDLRERLERMREQRLGELGY
jgi:heme exporter protein C